MEQRLESQQEKEKAQQQRKTQLQREADERRYDDLLSGGLDGDERPHKSARIEWMGFHREADDEDGSSGDEGGAKKNPATTAAAESASAPATRSKPAAGSNKTIDGGEKKITGKVEPTGAVSTSEAAQLRKEADDARKRRLDPLAKVLAVQDEYVSQVAKAQQQHSTHHHHPQSLQQQTAPSGCAVVPFTNSNRDQAAGSGDIQKKLQSAIQQLLAKKKSA